MKDKKKVLARSLGIITTITTLYIPQLISNVYAETCNIWLDGDTAPDTVSLGSNIDCIAGNIYSIAAKATLGLAIIFTLYTIFKTVTSQGNAKAMETIGTRWKYTIIFIIAAGAGGTLLNFGLKFLGFHGFQIMWNSTWHHLIDLLNGGLFS